MQQLQEKLDENLEEQSIILQQPLFVHICSFAKFVIDIKSLHSD